MGWFKSKKDGDSIASRSIRVINVDPSKQTYVSPSEWEQAHKRNLKPHPSGDALRLPLSDVERNEEGPKVATPPSLQTVDEEYGNKNAQNTFKRSNKEIRDDEEDDEEMSQGVVKTVCSQDFKSETGGHLNSLFNGHLMKWKFEAEEGTPFVRIPAFLGGVSSIITVTYSLVLYYQYLSVNVFVISGFVYWIAFTICILDSRFINSNPLGCRAHLRNTMTRHFNIFRFLWGRGILYIACGILSCSMLLPETLVSGVYLVVVGAVAICVGIYASHKFSTMRNSLADETFLLLQFSHVDYDDDGYIGLPAFAVLLTELGMELDDRYALKAFSSIDTDHDRKISFEEFCSWWSNGYIQRGRRDVLIGDAYVSF